MFGNHSFRMVAVNGFVESEWLRNLEEINGFSQLLEYREQGFLFQVSLNQLQRYGTNANENYSHC